MAWMVVTKLLGVPSASTLLRSLVIDLHLARARNPSRAPPTPHTRQAAFRGSADHGPGVEPVGRTRRRRSGPKQKHTRSETVLDCAQHKQQPGGWAQARGALKLSADLTAMTSSGVRLARMATGLRQ
eukprot:3446702-Rhodomonas_salina.4